MYASQFSIGGVVKYGGHLVTYHLETFSTTKLNYNTYDKELHALLQELK
jgi:hypothetical protein